MIRVGTAGWSIARAAADRFPAEGTALERYSARFDAVEVNSSFHRPHRVSTWAKWSASVPASFRFSVKLPKAITHQKRLAGSDPELGAFLDEVAGLGAKLAILLVQLPPKLELDPDVARPFFAGLGARTGAAIACEPRNLSWFTDEADAMLESLKVARVAADPAICAAAAEPGGWRGLSYYRLHGSPNIYRSTYRDRIGEIAAAIVETRSGNDWCMFDNTASSAATADALQMIDALAGLERSV